MAVIASAESKSITNTTRGSEFLHGPVLDLFVMLRATAPPTVIKSAARIAIEYLEALHAKASP